MVSAGCRVRSWCTGTMQPFCEVDCYRAALILLCFCVGAVHGPAIFPALVVSVDLALQHSGTGQPALGPAQYTMSIRHGICAILQRACTHVAGMRRCHLGVGLWTSADIRPQARGMHLPACLFRSSCGTCSLPSSCLAVAFVLPCCAEVHVTACAQVEPVWRCGRRVAGRGCRAMLPGSSG